MGVLTRIRNGEVNSSAARAMLGLYYREGAVYQIPFGPLRGLKLRYRTSINFHAMLGIWERPVFRFLTEVVDRRLLTPNATVCDVGANIGLFSLWLGRHAVPSGRVDALEPAPATFVLLNDTLALNGIRNIDADARACTATTGPVTFYVGAHHHVSSLNADWAGQGAPAAPLTVEGVALDDLYSPASGRPDPAFIKMDIEGGGTSALHGCDELVSRARPYLLIESHTPDEDRAISELLLRHDYHAIRMSNRRWVEERGAIYPHPEGVSGTLFLTPAERRQELQPLVA